MLFRSNKLLYIDNDLMLARLYLNHRIDACELTPDFVGNTDALFVGAASQAQCAIRAAHDRDRFYLRVDRLDRYLTAGDGIELKLRIGRKVYTLGANLGGKVWYALNDAPNADFGATAETTLCGELDVWAGNDNGAVTIFSLPREIFGRADITEIDVVMQNDDDGAFTEETLGGWQKIRIV